MENNIYTVDYFIKKFEAIPEEKWTEGIPQEFGRACAIGHCGVLSGLENYHSCEEARALLSLFYTGPFVGYEPVWKINDNFNPRYTQPTAKQRILAALYDIKAQQQPEVIERIVYVTVDAKVRELQKLESLC